ncbi:hypothetical protein E4O92_20600 [Massilia horti]|uniref:Uncharacterized protein n=2 Tax=Massilia horti TaxID=2562153 RepID=A0A4Y9STT8_9BURK|nr:hypothetical protein E4O92_20600 [Massilia horti]
MREDMFKVIVERPRLVNSNGYSRDGRKYRNHEETPNHLGMKRGYNLKKWLNENLAPLRRYLEKQVNRPWNKVYGEIRATIDPRSTVKLHVLQHIDDFVAIDTHWVETASGGKIIIRGQRWPRKDVPLEESRMILYVHPRTGILLRNRHYVSYDKRRRLEREAAQTGKLGVRRMISDDEQLHLIGGIWYRVTLGVLPPARMRIRQSGSEIQKETVNHACWDVVRKVWVSRQDGHIDAKDGQPSNFELYGDPNKYAVSKQQLNAHELRNYGLKT